jgi:hypothetical protein
MLFLNNANNFYVFFFKSKKQTKRSGSQLGSPVPPQRMATNALPAVGSRSPRPRRAVPAHGEDDATHASGDGPPPRPPRRLAFLSFLSHPHALVSGRLPGHCHPPPHTLIPLPSAVSLSTARPHPRDNISRRRAVPPPPRTRVGTARPVGLSRGGSCGPLDLPFGAGCRRSRCPARGLGSCALEAVAVEARRDPARSGGAGWICRRCSSGGRTRSLVRLARSPTTPPYPYF